MNTNNKGTTNDLTLEDEYEMMRLDALPPALRDLAGLHVLDQFESVPPYLQRHESSEKGQTHA
jgi:hypothetical protein